MMAAGGKAFEHVKKTILSAHESTLSGEKVTFYNSWAESYDQDVAVLDYRAPSLAANIISSHFSSDREAAVVLDVACGTGLVARQVIHKIQAMLMMARDSGLYQDLKQAMLGEEPLPVQKDLFDVVVIVGALSIGQVSVGVIRELCKSTKPGGHVCMTTRSNRDNVDYKASLERELKQMEDEGLWTCLEVAEVEDLELSFNISFNCKLLFQLTIPSYLPRVRLKLKCSTSL
uniref:Methyltransferase like 27 n=1 Tax=Gasterosteus aculeatus aculeatus TaxID=481459 RepID=G3QB50_GASAC